MINPGLVSITFRKLSPRDIIGLCMQGGVQGIEWGGDVHVPHGDVKTARRVRKMTEDAGLTVCSYGSYYKFDNPDLTFEAVLETGLELGAPVIRIWAGTKGSAEAEEDYRKRIADESYQAAELASGENIILAYEFHRNTLTDTAESVRNLLEKEAPHTALGTYWQPPTDESFQERQDGLKKVLLKLLWLHVFTWRQGTNERLPLSEGEKEWKRYFDIVRKGEGYHWALLEFVQDDSPEAFLRDAGTLKQWLANA